MFFGYAAMAAQAMPFIDSIFSGDTIVVEFACVKSAQEAQMRTILCRSSRATSGEAALSAGSQSSLNSYVIIHCCEQE
jgi:hypothetical protein